MFVFFPLLLYVTFSAAYIHGAHTQFKSKLDVFLSSVFYIDFTLLDGESSKY